MASNQGGHEGHQGHEQTLRHFAAKHELGRERQNRPVRVGRETV
jgi:hypothetical protein